MLQLPNHLATNHATYNDRKKNLQESLKTVIDHFRRLKVVYNTVENVSQTMDLKPAKVRNMCASPICCY